MKYWIPISGGRLFQVCPLAVEVGLVKFSRKQQGFFCNGNYRHRYERPGRSGSDDPDVSVVSSHHRDQIGVRNNHPDPRLRSDSVSVYLLAMCLHTVLFDVVPRREPLLPQLWLLHRNISQVDTALESSFYHS
ncbi:conserved hypothetical protein [Culex quinquefasciatus]|uniref:Uncharacterized protein n=1 Tax=Culex quinquefasciatus TaxID=7176 RepID=B0X8G0_CULQU|nr:conserved hypothetical protein [Culex quinquefasciatus]|eukprot:XP_001865932.1 conserved hypothetical protein [Culex quinquefasciatus]